MNLPCVNRRTFAGAVACLSVCGWAQPLLHKVRVIAVDSGDFYHLPLTLALQLGYFEAEGLAVEIVDVVGDARTLQTGPAGIDVVSGAYENTLELQAMSQPFQAFVLQSRTPAIALAVSTRALPNFKSVIDLRGKKIGVTALGSCSHRLAMLLLARAGLPADSVDFVVLGSSAQAPQALRSGQIDALSGVDPVLTLLEQKGEIRILADTRTPQATVAVFGSLMPAACLYASSGFLQKNRATVQALTNAVVRALKWLQTAGPRDLLKAVPEAYLLGDRALYLAAFNNLRLSLSTDGLFPDDGCRNVARALARFDANHRFDKSDVTKTYTNEFVKKAKARFKV